MKITNNLNDRMACAEGIKILTNEGTMEAKKRARELIRGAEAKDSSGKITKNAPLMPVPIYTFRF